MPCNQLYDIYDDIDVVKRFKIQRLRWLGHVARMDSSNPVRKVFESEQVVENRWVSEIGAKLQQLMIYGAAN